MCSHYSNTTQYPLTSKQPDTFGSFKPDIIISSVAGYMELLVNSFKPGKSIFSDVGYMVLSINSLSPRRCDSNSKSMIFKIYRIVAPTVWNSSLVNAKKPHQWEVNIGSGNGLVPSGNKPLPEPILTQICVTRPQWLPALFFPLLHAYTPLLQLSQCVIAA